MLRKPKSKSLGIVAAAALVLVGCGDGTGTASNPATTTQPTTTEPPVTTAPPSTAPPSTAPPPTTPPPTTPPPVDGAVPAAEIDRAKTAVLEFLDALGTGDIAAAKQRVGPVSEQQAGGSDELTSMLQASTEGHGAWSSAADREVTAVGMAPGIVAVALQGTLRVEGAVEHRVEVFPVRKAESGDVWFVEPWAYDFLGDPPVTVVSPAIDEEEQAEPGAHVVEIEAAAPGQVLVSFDGQAPEVAEMVAGESHTFGAGTDSADEVIIVFEAGPTLAASGFVTEAD